MIKHVYLLRTETGEQGTFGSLGKSPGAGPINDHLSNH